MNSSPFNLLVVDDDVLQARLLATDLAQPGRLEVEVVDSAPEALERLARFPVDAVLTDLMMPDMDGIELLGRIRQTDPTLPVILMSAFASVERAVEAVRIGATDVLPKPVDLSVVTTVLERAVAERSPREVPPLPIRHAGGGLEEDLFGAHPRLKAVREFARQVARAPHARVLITGETGTGKSLLARMIHDLSGTPGEFMEVNCAALPAQLLESELFGQPFSPLPRAASLR